MQSAPRITKQIPPLRDGDRLSVKEFMRRYEAMPGLKKAELIEGVVYMPSPVTIDDHGDPHSMLVMWLAVYRALTPGVQTGDNATVKLDVGENTPQPDVCLRVLPEYGGQTRREGKYIGGAPELVAEVAASSISYDLGDKLDVYRRNGVKEYVVWRVNDHAVDWYVLRGGEYRRQAKRGGLLKSKAFPGLWLDADALLTGNFARVLEVVQAGAASDEHRRFVAQLAKRKR